jgi:hypothetical protein
MSDVQAMTPYIGTHEISNTVTTYTYFNQHSQASSHISSNMNAELSKTTLNCDDERMMSMSNTTYMDYKDNNNLSDESTSYSNNTNMEKENLSCTISNKD